MATFEIVGSLYISEHLVVDQNTLVSGYLEVGDNQYISGYLEVGGNMLLNGYLEVLSTTELHQNVTLNSNLFVNNIIENTPTNGTNINNVLCKNGDITCGTLNYTNLNPPTLGSGDVIGPVSSTDNAIVRFDGVNGKFIQDSTATLTNTGDLTINDINANDLFINNLTVAQVNYTTLNPSVASVTTLTPTIAFIGAIPSTNANLVIQKVGRQIMLYIPSLLVIATSTSPSIIASSAIDISVRPVTDSEFPVFVYNNTLAQPIPGKLKLTSAGIITIFGNSGANFQNTTTCGWNAAIHISYITS